MNNLEVLRASGSRVCLGENSYDVMIGIESLSLFGPALRETWPGRRLFVIVNDTVRTLYADAVIASATEAGFETSLILIPDGEAFKNLDTVNLIYTELLKAGADRGVALAALGGGVTGDIAGFAAATFMRGIPYIQVPTTLLAQVDSSVGGKTGVNHQLGKNLIGAFCQPKLVFVDISTLRTVKENDFQSGMFEVIKYGLIRDEDFFACLVRNMERIKSRDERLLQDTVRRCCEIKADVVNADEKESGLRRILNIGHTLGHALEAVTGYSEIPHGQAVGYGMVASAYLSLYLGLIDESTLARVVAGILSIGGFPSVDHVPVDEVVRACGRDKKRQGDKVIFVLLDRIGHTVIQPLDLSDGKIARAWRATLEAVDSRQKAQGDGWQV